MQVIDPEVHNLIAGGPELRRRFLDWIAFHVEHDHLAVWRRFRRALKQRNAALSQRGTHADQELERGVRRSVRRIWTRRGAGVLELAWTACESMGRALLETDLGFEYQQGWTK